MTLTEKWKKGELKEGWYYIRNKAHSIKFNQMAFFMVFGEVSYWTNCKDEDVEEVLAPVPSYEEWNQLRKFLEEFNALEVANENEQLKDLLKEWREHLKDTKCDRCQNLIRRTDNAIGEK
jgi:hypothetical protein